MDEELRTICGEGQGGYALRGLGSSGPLGHRLAPKNETDFPTFGSWAFVQSFPWHEAPDAEGV